MRSVLVHVSMVLLGVTLTAGFYEGRRLVKNTAKALEAADSLASSAGRQSAREGLAREPGADEERDGSVTADLGGERFRARKMQIDPSQIGPGRARAVPRMSLEGGVGEPPDPRGRRRGGGRGGRRGGKAGLRSMPDPAGALERLDRAEELPQGAGGADPAGGARDTGSP